MNKNTILGFFFIFLIMMGYTWYTAPTEDERERHQAELMKQDSLKRIEDIRIAEKDSLRIAEAAIKAQNNLMGIESGIEQNDSAINQAIMNKYGSFAAATKGEEKDYILENEKLKIKISSKGGAITYAEIKNYSTYDTLPLVLFDSKTASMSYLLNDKNVQTKDLYFEAVVKESKPNTDSIYIKSGDDLNFAMRLYPNDINGSVDKSKFLEFEYIISGDDYMIDYRMNMQGVSDIVSPGHSDIPLFWNMDLYTKEKDAEQEFKQTAVYYRYFDQDADNLGEMDAEDEEELDTKVQWISFKQQFFSMALIAENNFVKADIKQTKNADIKSPKYMKSMSADISIPLANYSDFQSIPMKIYMGPNKFKVLKEYELQLERQIPLGWGFFLLHWINRIAVIPLFDFLSGFGWNYGIIILVLTIMLKIFLFPIAYRTYVSSAKMRVLKPEVDELAAKYPKKEDAMKKQQATMALYKKAGANPMSGCIPMLLQMPILFALFRFFPSAIELRQQSFLWADDLSSYDAIWSWSTQIPLLSKFYGNHISLFTLLMTVTTILYTRINNQMMGSQQQMPGMKTMMYLMPLMFLGFFNNYASGLSYYYMLANLITFGQMYMMRMFIDENAIKAKIQLNKKKPVKQSKFQKRLEDMAKQKGYTPKR